MIAIVLAVILASVLVFVACAPQMGAVAQGDRLVRVKQSPHFSEGKFRNLVPTRVSTSNRSMTGAMWDYFTVKTQREPLAPVPSVKVDPDSIPLSRGLRVTWLGHSTCLIEIGGQVVLTDPMFSDRASPLSFAGPKRFDSEPPLLPEQLKRVDTVVISHDHYDHLDYRSIQVLDPVVSRYMVPLGVGGHLERWGISPEKITELDWWEEANEGPLHFVATPARHFSGRSLTDGNKTLWASWVIEDADHRVFFGGDSGYFDGFKDIGYKYGPFDITLLESGAYNEAWSEIHMMPEQTVQAHRDLNGKVLLPIHWAKFNLALHAWTEPIERVAADAGFQGVRLATPRLGESFHWGKNVPSDRWWETVDTMAAVSREVAAR